MPEAEGRGPAPSPAGECARPATGSGSRSEIRSDLPSPMNRVLVGLGRDQAPVASSSGSARGAAALDCGGLTPLSDRPPAA